MMQKYENIALNFFYSFSLPNNMHTFWKSMNRLSVDRNIKSFILSNWIEIIFKRSQMIAYPPWLGTFIDVSFIMQKDTEIYLR